MTDPRIPGPPGDRARPLSRAGHGPREGRAFLTAITCPRADGAAEPCDNLQELLASVRHLVLVAPTGGWESIGDCARYRSALHDDAILTLLPSGPAGTTMADEPARWLDVALGSPACRSDAMGRETTVVVTEDLQVLAPDTQGAQELRVICDLGREPFVPAWNRHLERAATSETLSRVADVLCRVEPDAPGTARDEDLSGEACAARIVELEGQVRELSHERKVLRENRDSARKEHLQELREHRALNDENRAKVDANQRELDRRLARLDKLQATVSELEAHHATELDAHRASLKACQLELAACVEELEARAAELEAGQQELRARAAIIDELREAVESMETILRRTRAVRIAKWLDRLGGLRRVLPGGGS